MKGKFAIIIVVIVALFLFLKRKSIMTYDLLASLLSRFEGFSSTPYFDYKQYSWGYGTAVPSQYLVNGKPVAGAQISRANAFIDAMNHVRNDESYLRPLVKIELTPKQWAAYLSFSYNLGTGNADNLITNINAKNWSALKTQWLAYVKAGGKVNADLVARRSAEWQLFSSDIK